MTIFGRIEEFVGTYLYPWRWLIAALLVAGVIAFIVVAVRRGWVAAARRHPGRVAAVALPLLAVGIPVGWYLASPLFIRTELNEAAPIPVTTITTVTTPPSTTTSPPAEPDPSAATTTTTNTTVPEPEGPAGVVATGTFLGADEFHFGSGNAVVIETAPGAYTLRFEDFSVRNGPELYVYLSPTETYDEQALEVGRLKATDGSFNYELPAGTDPSQFQSVIVWCRPFGVLFASALLSA